MRSQRVRTEARRIARDILLLAVEMAKRDLEMAKEQAKLARKVIMKHNVRLGYPLKRFYCHGCKGFIVPGINARVRMGRNGAKIIRITCLECGHINRKIIFKRPKG